MKLLIEIDACMMSTEIEIEIESEITPNQISVF